MSQHCELHDHSETDEAYELHRIVGGRERYSREDCGFGTSCWIWRMWVEPTGYAYSKAWGGRAHRGLYKLLIRDPGVAVILHHRCEQPACVNPWHMEEMTHLEHNRLHKLGKKMRLSEAERERRRVHGRAIAKMVDLPRIAYTKQSRADVAKRRGDLV